LETETTIRLELHNADPRSSWHLQKALEDEGLDIRVELPMEYRSGVVDDFGTAVFYVLKTGTAGALAMAAAPTVQRAGSATTQATRDAVRRAVDKFRAKGSPAGPLEGPDDIIPKR
jgi:hypothetical protein